ncbi:MAG: prenyltransferase/squalene oxidase repeat-containing protein [Gemmataceae bacterium]
MRKLALVLLLAVSGPVRADDTSPAAKDVRATLEKSLAFVDKASTAWVKERKCVSCHHVTFQLWGQRLAAQQGFASERKALDERQAWTVDFVLNSRDKQGQPNGHGVDTVVQLLLGRAADYGDEKTKAKTDRLVDLLIKLQNQDGSWSAGGQLPDQQRPKPETQAVTTMWAVLALGSLEPTDEHRASLARAVRWLRSSSGSTTEWLALRILYEQRFGSKEEAAVLLEQLKDQQNPDGGWGWHKGRPSDALATGITLFVLARWQQADNAKARARSFLVNTQQADGSWQVPTTKQKTKDLSIVRFWGTAWATIGLLATMS